MKKVIVVKTDDPNKKKFNVVVTGPVEKIVDVTPASVYLKGKPGQILSAIVNITPKAKYPFSLVSVKQRENSQFQVDMVKSGADSLTWQLNIKRTSDVNGSSYDVLKIKTDSKYKPEIIVRVTASFYDGKNTKSQDKNGFNKK